MQSYVNLLVDSIVSRSLTVGVIGLGHVGLPLVRAIAKAGFRTIGFDVDPEKIAILNAGKSYIGAVKDDEIEAQRSANRFRATADFLELSACGVVIMCVPTPLTRHRDPDLSFVVDTARAIARCLKAGQLIVLESTTFPGTLMEVVKPILEASGLKSGTDFFLGYSPEREDPGNPKFDTVRIPKVVAGDGDDAQGVMEEFYRAVVEVIVPVSSPAVAEAVKITENVFRAVNIALVNELKVIYGAMGIDIWEVIDAAATKPFGYMPFYPGPGLGGHCVPIDPFYLTWKAKEFDLSTRFIELAGEINLSMPDYVINRLEEALDRRCGVPLGRARVLLLGLAYKKNVADVRESPAFKVIRLLERRGAIAEFHDPHVQKIPLMREHAEFAGRVSVALSRSALESYNAIVIVTDHDAVDYESVARYGRLVVDTRNVLARKGIHGEHIVKA